MCLHLGSELLALIFLPVASWVTVFPSLVKDTEIYQKQRAVGSIYFTCRALDDVSLFCQAADV